MSFDLASSYVSDKGYGDRIKVFEQSSATVELAAIAVGTNPGNIAKSLTFMVNEKPVMIVCAGDVKIDNSKYKQQFSTKAKMLTREEVEELIGHAVGGVCPFGIKEGVQVYMDISLKQYDPIYPACGSGNSAVELHEEELVELSQSIGWIDVTKPMNV
ncbi:MAG: YbaK/EbsC family protein [Lachnospiraceae bacterium]|nr:YbaK/EbsC family protein [Lachnospiraceae bacterium]